MTPRTHAYDHLLTAISETLSYIDAHPRDYSSNALAIELEQLKLDLETRRDTEQDWESEK